MRRAVLHVGGVVIDCTRVILDTRHAAVDLLHEICGICHIDGDRVRRDIARRALVPAAVGILRIVRTMHALHRQHVVRRRMSVVGNTAIDSAAVGRRCAVIGDAPALKAVDDPHDGFCRGFICIRHQRALMGIRRSIVPRRIVCEMQVVRSNALQESHAVHALHIRDVVRRNPRAIDADLRPVDARAAECPRIRHREHRIAVCEGMIQFEIVCVKIIDRPYVRVLHVDVQRIARDVIGAKGGAVVAVQHRPVEIRPRLQCRARPVADVDDVAHRLVGAAGMSAVDIAVARADRAARNGDCIVRCRSLAIGVYRVYSSAVDVPHHAAIDVDGIVRSIAVVCCAPAIDTREAVLTCGRSVDGDSVVLRIRAVCSASSLCIAAVDVRIAGAAVHRDRVPVRRTCPLRIAAVDLAERAALYGDAVARDIGGTVRIIDLTAVETARRAAFKDEAVARPLLSAADGACAHGIAARHRAVDRAARDRDAVAAQSRRAVCVICCRAVDSPARGGIRKGDCVVF